MKRITRNIQLKTKQRGQVMLLTVLVISALFLGATAIAGLLMNYQLRQVTNIVDATKAIFAADTAIERALFVIYRCNGGAPVLPQPPPAWPDDLDTPEFCGALASQDASDDALPEFFNNTTYRLIIETSCNSGGHVPNAASSTVACIKAAGQAGKSTRALGVFF